MSIIKTKKMKNLFIILLYPFLLFSCDKETIIKEVVPTCDCTKTYTNYFYDPQYNVVREKVLYAEKVQCQTVTTEPIIISYSKEGGATYFEIKCK